MENVAASVEQPMFIEHDPFGILCAGGETKYMSDFDDEDDEPRSRLHDGDDEPFYRANRFDCALARIAAPPPSPQEPSVLEQHFGQKLSAQLQQVSRQEAAQSHASTLDKLLRRTINCSRQQSTRGIKKSYRPVAMAARRTCTMKRHTSRIPLSSHRIQARAANYRATAELADAIALVHLSSDTEEDRPSSKDWDCSALRPRVDPFPNTPEITNRLNQTAMEDMCDTCETRTSRGSNTPNKRVETIIQDLREMGL